jgi:two-component system sensor histidine kinase RpfC
VIEIMRLGAKMKNSEKNEARKTLVQVVLGGTDDPVRSEREQAFLRLAIALLGFQYLFTQLHITNVQTVDLIAVKIFCSIFLIVAVAVLGSTYIHGQESEARKIFGVVIDILGFSFVLAVSGENAAPWFPVYLWVIFGNTLRYGIPYLYFSSILSILSFGTVLVFSSYWQTNLSMGIGLLVSLLVLPGYAAALAQRLRNAQLTAENANQAKSQFLANMSHEIRTPLNGIIGAAELLKERELPAEDKRFIEIINHSGSTLLQLINDILDLSKIEANKLVSETEPFDLHEFLGSLTEMMDIQAQKRGLRLLLSVDPRIPYHVQGDERYLKQVLINLLGNAIKFTEEGEVELHCELASPPSAAGSLKLEFSVRDTGIGIPLDQQEKILEPFVQAESTTSRRFGGTGLGTSIARDLVELMGGELSLESAPGEGTTFYFTLPMVGRTVLSLVGNKASETIVCSRLHEWSVNVLSANDVSRAEQLLRKASREYAPIAAIVLDKYFVQNMEFTLERWRREALISDDVVVVVASLQDEAPDFSAETHSKPFSPHQVWVETEDELFNALHAVRFPCDLGGETSAVQEDKVHVLNILIADDNITNRIILSKILRNAGHRVVETDSGGALLEAVEEEAFDLALVDMHMPDMNGIETFQLYHFAHASEEAIPFVIITADVTEATRSACMDAGIETILSKPIDSKQVLDAIEALTSEAAAPVPAKEEPVTAPESPDEVPMVDPGKVEELLSLGTGLALAESIWEGFMEDAGNTLVQMKKAVEERDYFGMKDLAHALRGSAANVGLLKVQLASRHFELQPEDEFMRVRPGEIDQLEELVHESARLLHIEFGLEKPRPELRVVS